MRGHNYSLRRTVEMMRRLRAGGRHQWTLGTHFHPHRSAAGPCELKTRHRWFSTLGNQRTVCGSGWRYTPSKVADNLCGASPDPPLFRLSLHPDDWWKNRHNAHWGVLGAM